VRYVGEIANSVEALQKLVKQLRKGDAQLSFCYEAGPCGYPEPVSGGRFWPISTVQDNEQERPITAGSMLGAWTFARHEGPHVRVKTERTCFLPPEIGTCSYHRNGQPAVLTCSPAWKRIY
jgi:hypothetical protein